MQDNWKFVLLIVYYDVGYYNIDFVRVQNNWKCVLLIVIVYHDVGYYKIRFVRVISMYV